MGNLLGPISRRRRREQLFPTRDAAGCEDGEHVPRPSRARENRRHPFGQGDEPGCHQRCSSRLERGCPYKILAPGLLREGPSPSSRADRGLQLRPRPSRRRASAARRAAATLAAKKCGQRKDRKP